MSENVFLFPSFLKNIFTESRILGWQFFSFSIWKISHVLLASKVPDEKSTVIWIVFLLCYFSLATFKTFSSSCSLTFQKFNYNVSWHEFWSLSCSGFTQFLESEVCVSCQIWEVCSHYFFWVLFQFCLHSLLFQNSNDTNVTSFIIVPQVPEALFIFFQSIFLSVV